MISKDELLAYLQKIDAEVKEPVTLIAVGGTAMTLLGIKDTTKDVDFCIETKKDRGTIKKLIEKSDSRIRVDLFSEGYIFSVQLPKDYARLARPVKGNFRNVKLKTLHPIDLIISKTDRLNERDIEDIEVLIKSVNKAKLQQRYKQVIDSIPGRRENFEYNIRQVLKLY
ncbi:hypothetical protein HYU40_00025 [Candidatus Woesearchaeota archaeon]|nr:hypothetical protein [Candidatus Woesearchaeota archaeon]